MEFKEVERLQAEGYSREQALEITLAKRINNDTQHCKSPRWEWVSWYGEYQKVEEPTAKRVLTPEDIRVEKMMVRFGLIPLALLMLAALVYCIIGISL